MGYEGTRQRPTFPQPRSCSIIGPGGLNFRVRDGNGCGPSGVVTGISFVSGKVKKIWEKRRKLYFFFASRFTLHGISDHVYQK